MQSLKCVLILKYLIVISNADLSLTRSTNLAFDPKLYEDVLDSRLCSKHLDYVTSNLKLYFQFLDSGLRIPNYMIQGNRIDFGSYNDCLGIREQIDDMVIDGKYCRIKVTLPQNMNQQSTPNSSEWEDIHDLITKFPNKHEFITLKYLEKLIEVSSSNNSRSSVTFQSPSNSLQLALCLPKVCTTRESLERLYYPGLQYEDKYCRLRDDKPWTPADTVSTILLILIGLITVISTAYDIYKSIILKDPKGANAYLRAFSVYTNTQRLLTHVHIPGAIECMDGVRAFATAWVIVLHTFHIIKNSSSVSNPSDFKNWIVSAQSLWIYAAPKAVDTFFTLSGILVVYTNAGKFTSVGLLKNLHLFYLNRLLRLFPVLAFVVLLQVSLFHRVADGPDWTHVAKSVNNCRFNWWSTLLYVQNYVHPFDACLPHAWYLSVDTQLHIISPIVLFWVFSGKKLRAWIALIAGLLISLIIAIIYIFLTNPSLLNARYKSREEFQNYFQDYYINTLTRSSPFFVGMIFGYILHLKRSKQIILNKIQVAVLWASSLCISSAAIYSHHYQTNYSGENQIAANLINIFGSPAWALTIGLMILACQHGYGGPISWILSIKELKVLSKISYSMYIFHYSMMEVYNGAAMSTIYFSVAFYFFIFLGQYVITVVCGFVITLIVEMPASFYTKKLIGAIGGRSKDVEGTSKKFTLNHQ